MTKEKFKTYGDVFDNFTALNIHKLISQKMFEGLKSPVSIGKEANIFTAQKKDKDVIVKIYRLETCDFNKMFSYLRTDPRFPHLKSKRRKVIFEWAKREYVNLMKARVAGVKVPTPITFKDNIVVMEKIGKIDPAPKIKDRLITKEIVERIMEYMKKLHKSNMIHGDLSGYNILLDEDRPVFIDFSQATTLDNPNAKEWLERDIRNISSFFKKKGIDKSEKEIWDYISDKNKNFK